MICSGDLGFYEKRSLPPLSVTNKRSRRTEIEKMSNFRNLLCTVALHNNGLTHVGETLGEIESHQHGVALGEPIGLLVRPLDSW